MMMQIRGWLVAGLCVFLLVYWIGRKAKDKAPAKTAFGCGCLVVITLALVFLARIVMMVIDRF